MELNLNQLSDDVIHISGFGGEDGGVVPQVDTVHRHG
jgi:hypothetical protein